jgi:hypothetical protein
MDWQPIETAPKDGRPILAYVSGTLSFGGTYETMTTVKWMGDGWSLCAPGAHAISDEWDFTHWMPLPEPPTSSV